MEKIVDEIVACKEKFEQIPMNKEAQAVSREEFTLLLSGISTCRKMPGISTHMGYEELYHCVGKEDIEKALDFMGKMFRVKDKETLMETCYGMYSGSNQYEQFMTFWNDAPLYDLKELNPDGKESFLHCKQLAEKFYPIVKEKGFYAWDINERIGLCRNAVACGIISEEEFWQVTDPWVRQAQVFYHSYTEYAWSCLCGAVYDMSRYDSDINGFFQINLNIIENLLGEGGAWQQKQCYVPKEREWADLLESNMGCFITKKAVDQEEIGYMYRDEPSPNHPDSGWRFFVGDESEEYVNQSDNIVICGLNTVCNINPEIMAFLHADIGKRFGKHENGWEEE